MLEVEFGKFPEIASWVADNTGVPGFGESYELGIYDGRLIAGIVYSTYHPHVPSIEISIFSVDPRWCTRATLMAVFGFPFLTLNIKRLWAVCRKKNRHARQFVKRLGFVEEGCLRQAFPDDDGVMYSMMREECIWCPKVAAEALSIRAA